MFQVVLKDLREDIGLSQRELAIKLGIAQSTVGMWESGKREPDYKTLNKLSNFFDVPSSLFLGSYPFQHWDLIRKNKVIILEEINKRFPELLDETGVSYDGRPLNKFAKLLNMVISDVEVSAQGEITLVFTAEWAIEMLKDDKASHLKGDSQNKSKKKEPAAQSGELTQNEKRLIDLFRLVPADKQKLVADMVEAALKSQGLLK